MQRRATYRHLAVNRLVDGSNPVQGSQIYLILQHFLPHACIYPQSYPTTPMVSALSPLVS
jgi:hypothetical protein